jgi:2-polyprenyl-3-methyl-5-hydroxy-6-metoxy-1,4-benzoquinol methylase
MTDSSLYLSKANTYFSAPRMDLIRMIPVNPENRILELGAGTGDTLLKIKELMLAKEVVGIELLPIANSHQSNSLIDKFIIGDIESMKLPLLENYFDIILCGDVLEHLVNPWKVVEVLTQHLKPNGVFVVSIPNFRDLKTLTKIFINGDFGYESMGVLDRTHLRFFCKKNILQLLTTTQLQPQSIIPSFIKNPNQKHRKTLSNLTFGLLEEFLTIQYLIIAKKVAPN